MDKHVKYHLINSALAGGLVFLGTIIDGNITLTGVLAGIGTGLIVCLTKFKEFWVGHESEYTSKLFSFI